MGQKSQLHVSYTWDGIAVSIENSCNAVEKNGALRFFICFKTRQHIRREQAEGMWKDLLRKGWQKVPDVWGADAEP